MCRLLLLLSATVFADCVCCCCYLLPWSLLVNPPVCSFKQRAARTTPRNHSSSLLVVPNGAAVTRAVTTAPTMVIRLMLLENTTAHPRPLATLEASGCDGAVPEDVTKQLLGRMAVSALDAIQTVCQLCACHPGVWCASRRVRRIAAPPTIVCVTLTVYQVKYTQHPLSNPLCRIIQLYGRTNLCGTL